PRTDPERLVYIYRKMLAYYFTYELGIHTKLFGFQEFRALFVTTNSKRMENMIESNQRFNNGAGSELFLFTNRRSFWTAKNVVRHTWINGRREQVTLTE
ncbi:MAG: hypothetical protein MN733_29095, partial [Nitrososphaera sp.]|nr:hypothetical protein [Nitrososphaera sp.]